MTFRRKRYPPRLLLINPPHSKRVVRDCYCSDIVKADYYWHQMDLVVQSALLKNRADLFLIDAIASGMDSSHTLQRVNGLEPDIVLCLVGEVILEDDLAFCRALRRSLPQAVLIGSGDFFLDDPTGALQTFSCLDAALLDFTSPDLSRIVEGENPVHDMVLRDNGAVKQLPRSQTGSFSYSIPPDDLFKAEFYRLPFYGGEPFYSLLASYGCPFECHFCHVPSLGYKRRNPGEVLAEMKAAVALGFHNMYIRDATFGVREDDALDICERISSEGLSIRWNCFTRADLLDTMLLEAMAKAGCTTVQIGVETLDRNACEVAGKSSDLPALRHTLEDCRRLGILTSLHFVIGLPGDRWMLSEEAAQDIIGLKPDYFSVNVLHPRSGSAMKRRGLRLSRAQIKRFRSAARRLHMRFYLRPGRVVEELLRLKTYKSILRGTKLFRSMFLSSFNTRSIS